MNGNSLQLSNPWWENPKAIREDLHLLSLQNSPFYYDNSLKNILKIEKGNTFILRGPRQVGKTTLLKEKIKQALDQKILPASNCLYMSCENIKDFSELQNLLTPWLSKNKNKASLICLDEISFVSEWQRSILWFLNTGLLSQSTLLITGSNARDLKKSAERFPGRKVKEIQVHPLSIWDFKNLPAFCKLSNDECFRTYLKVGGFPHALADFISKGFVTDETYQTYAHWIFGDAFRFELNREILIHVFYRIFETSGSQISWQGLVEKSPIKSHETMMNYLEHLESSFIAKVVPCYDSENHMAAPRKSKKIYFIDPLLYPLAGLFLQGIPNTFSVWEKKIADPSLTGHIFEAIVMSHLARKEESLYFWYSSKSKKEVDALVKKGTDLYLYEMKLQFEKMGPILGQEVKIITPEIFVSGDQSIGS